MKSTKYRTKPVRVSTSSARPHPAADPRRGWLHPVLPQRGGVEPVLEKDPLDRVAPDLVTEIAECAADSGVALAGVVPSHPENQPFDLGRRLGAARPARLAAIVLVGD